MVSGAYPVLAPPASSLCVRPTLKHSTGGEDQRLADMKTDNDAEQVSVRVCAREGQSGHAPAEGF